MDVPLPSVVANPRRRLGRWGDVRKMLAEAEKSLERSKDKHGERLVALEQAACSRARRTALHRRSLRGGGGLVGAPIRTQEVRKNMSSTPWYRRWAPGRKRWPPWWALVPAIDPKGIVSNDLKDEIEDRDRVHRRPGDRDAGKKADRAEPAGARRPVSCEVRPVAGHRGRGADDL